MKTYDLLVVVSVTRPLDRRRIYKGTKRLMVLGSRSTEDPDPTNDESGRDQEEVHRAVEGLW